MHMVAARLGFEKAIPHALTAWTGLENTTLTLQRAGFLQERLLSPCRGLVSCKKGCLVSERVYGNQ